MKSNYGITCEVKEKPTLKLASFPKRLAAAGIDGVLIIIMNLTVSVSVVLLFGVITNNFLVEGAPWALGQNAITNIVANASEMLLMWSLMAIGPPLLFGYCESSNWQATPGKRLMKLKITDVSGNRLSFWNAAWRMFLAEFLVLLFIGIPMGAALVYYLFWRIPVEPWVFQEVSIIESMLIGVCLLAALFTKQKQTLMDVVTKRVVLDASADIESEHLIESKSKHTLSRELSNIKPKSGTLKPLYVVVSILALSLTVLAAEFAFMKYRPDMTPEKKTKLAKIKAELEEKMKAKGTVVYAIKDIPQGGYISYPYLEEKEIPQCKIPQDSIESAKDAYGRIAKYKISQGQIVSIDDLKEGEPDFTLSVPMSKKDMYDFWELGGDEKLASSWIKQRLKKELSK